jgi:hypothetical protein
MTAITAQLIFTEDSNILKKLGSVRVVWHARDKWRKKFASNCINVHVKSSRIIVVHSPMLPCSWDYNRTASGSHLSNLILVIISVTIKTTFMRDLQCHHFCTTMKHLVTKGLTRTSPFIPHHPHQRDSVALFVVTGRCNNAWSANFVFYYEQYMWRIFIFKLSRW